MSAASTLVTRAMRAVQDRIRERYRLRGEIARMDSTKNPTEIAHDWPPRSSRGASAKH